MILPMRYIVPAVLAIAIVGCTLVGFLRWGLWITVPLLWPDSNFADAVIAQLDRAIARQQAVHDSLAQAAADITAYEMA